MTPITFLDGRVTLHGGDCLDILKTLPDASVDSVVTDPPYHLTSIVKRFGGVNAAPAKVGQTGAFARASRGFMGQTWDGGDIAFRPELWAEVLRVLKPGGHLAAFSGTRTYHRMAVAIEDAGFEIRDQLAWTYGSGFPKSHDVSKAIDKRGGDALAWRAFSEAYAQAVSASTLSHSDIDRELGIKSSSCYWARTDHRGGMPPRHHWESVRALLSLSEEFAKLYDEAEREVVGSKKSGIANKAEGQRHTIGASSAATVEITAPATEAARRWRGWGTALKPAWEPICLARKPLAGTVAENVLAHGVGALNIDGCRVESEGGVDRVGEASQDRRYAESGGTNFAMRPGPRGGDPLGRFPANLIHDGSADVVSAFPNAPGQQGELNATGRPRPTKTAFGDMAPALPHAARRDAGSAARFFYTAKADADDRIGSKHPTVKPVDLMQWLVRLITPKGGTVLDLFAGTGTTGEAAWREGCSAVLIEREAEYQADIARRMELAKAGPDERRRRMAALKPEADAGPLFGGEAA